MHDLVADRLVHVVDRDRDALNEHDGDDDGNGSYVADGVKHGFTFHRWSL